MPTDLLGKLRNDIGETGPDKERNGFGNDALEQGIASNGAGDDDTMKMKMFFSRAKEAKTKIEMYKKATAAMEEIYKKSFGSKDENEFQTHSVEIESLQGEQDTRARQIREILDQMSETTKKLMLDRKNANKNADIRIRTTHQPYLCKLFSEAIKGQQEMQTKYKEKYKAQVERQYRIVNPNAKNEDIEKLFSEDSAKASIFQKELVNIKEDAKETLEAMNNRFESMRILEQSIITLSKLFMDMQNMVILQGDILNKICEEIGTATEHVDTALEDVKEAQKIADSIRKKKFFLTMIILLAVVILFLAVYKFIFIDILNFNLLVAIFGGNK